MFLIKWIKNAPEKIKEVHGNHRHLQTWGSWQPFPLSPPAELAEPNQTTVPALFVAAAFLIGATQFWWKWSWSYHQDHWPQLKSPSISLSKNDGHGCFHKLWCDAPGSVFWFLDPHSWRGWWRHQNPPKEKKTEPQSLKIIQNGITE